MSKKIIIKKKTEQPAKKSIVVKKQKPVVVKKLKTAGKGILPRGMGPQAVTVLKDGRRVCWRFFVVKFHGVSAPATIREVLKQSNMTGEQRWFVIDAAEDDKTYEIARGSSKNGYEELAEAKRVCEQYREKYGDYVEFDF